MKHNYHQFFFVLFCGIFVSHASANVVSFSSSSPLLDESILLDSSFDGQSLFNQETVTGLPKFDSSLGTLTGISLDIAFDFSYSLQIEAYDVVNPSLAHSVEFSTSFTDIEIIYNGTQFGHVIGSQALEGGLGCSESSGSDVCFNDFFDSGFFDETGLGDIVTASDYVESDFVGVGDVEALDVWFVAYEFGSLLENSDDYVGDLSFNNDPGTVTIHYEYSPVPVPAAAWLFVSGVLGLSVWRRKYA